MARATQENFFFRYDSSITTEEHRENGSNFGNHSIIFWAVNPVTITEETWKKPGSGTIFSSTRMHPDQDISVNREVHKVLHC